MKISKKNRTTIAQTNSAMLWSILLLYYSRMDNTMDYYTQFYGLLMHYTIGDYTMAYIYYTMVYTQ